MNNLYKYLIVIETNNAENSKNFRKNHLKLQNFIKFIVFKVILYDYIYLS